LFASLGAVTDAHTRLTPAPPAATGGDACIPDACGCTQDASAERSKMRTADFKERIENLDAKFIE
jgi:hypothetical protein